MNWRVVVIIGLLFVLGACSSSDGDNIIGEDKDDETITTPSEDGGGVVVTDANDTVIASPDFSSTTAPTANQNIQPTSNVPIAETSPLPPTLANQVEDCNRRYDLPLYSVQAGENLTVIAQNYGITVSELIEWNCLANPNRLLRGDLLHVPRRPIDTDPLCSEDVSQATGDDVVAILPYATFDGDCYRLTILTTVTISWYTTATDLAEVTFYYVNESAEGAQILGIDDTPEDGFSVSWRVPQNFTPSRIYATGIGVNGDAVGSDPVVVYTPQAQ